MSGSRNIFSHSPGLVFALSLEANVPWSALAGHAPMVPRLIPGGLHPTGGGSLGSDPCWSVSLFLYDDDDDDDGDEDDDDDDDGDDDGDDGDCDDDDGDDDDEDGGDIGDLRRTTS